MQSKSQHIVCSLTGIRRKQKKHTHTHTNVLLHLLLSAPFYLFQPLLLLLSSSLCPFTANALESWQHLGAKGDFSKLIEGKEEANGEGALRACYAVFIAVWFRSSHSLSLSLLTNGCTQLLAL